MNKVATLVYQDCIFCTVSARREWGLSEKKKAEAMGYVFESESYLTDRAQEIIAKNPTTPLPYIYADGKVVHSMDELKKKTPRKKKAEAKSGE